MIKGAFGSVRALADTLVKTTSLLILGLAVSVAFKCKIWNIGAEGQLYFGALGGLLAGLSFIGAVPILAPIAVIILGFAFGSLFSMIPAVLKVKLGVNEVIVTVLLNFVALLFISYLLHGPKGQASSLVQISPQSELQFVPSNTRLSADPAAVARVRVWPVDV
jgi:simple sugar transport system permease protein